MNTVIDSAVNAMIDLTDVAVWERYEQRKRALQNQGMTQREYELAVRRLADELGV